MKKVAIENSSVDTSMREAFVYNEYFMIQVALDPGGITGRCCIDNVLHT